MTVPDCTKPLPAPESHVRWGGGFVAVGAVLLLATNILYMRAPLSIALPGAALPLDTLARDATAAQPAMRYAGLVGTLADVVAAAGALLLMLRRPAHGAGTSQPGWALIVLGLVMFIIVDALFARVLGPLAQAGTEAQGLAPFAALKGLFDLLFALASASGALGELGVFLDDARADQPVLPRWANYLGLGGAVAYLSAAALYFFGGILLPLWALGLYIPPLVLGALGARLAWPSR